MSNPEDKGTYIPVGTRRPSGLGRAEKAGVIEFTGSLADLEQALGLRIEREGQAFRIVPFERPRQGHEKDRLSASLQPSVPDPKQRLAEREAWRQHRLTLTYEQRVAEERRMIRAMSWPRYRLWLLLARLGEVANRLAASVGPFPSPYG